MRAVALRRRAMPALALALALGLSGLGHAAEAHVDAGPGLASTDGRFSLQVQAQELLLTDGAGQPLKRWPLRDRDGRPVQVQALAHHAPRQQWVVALAGAPELWLISHDPAAPPLYNGWVHDWRMAEGIAEPGYLGLQRVRLAQAFSALWVDGRVPWLLGQAPGRQGGLHAVVLHLDIRREIAWLPPNGTMVGPLAATRLLPGPVPGRWQLALPANPGWWVVDDQRWQGRHWPTLP